MNGEIIWARLLELGWDASRKLGKIINLSIVDSPMADDVQNL